MTQDGYVIEPEYIGYRSGDTVKDVLKKSSHTFSGIDSGYITAVDGTTDNFSIHYDEDGYKLDQSADGLTAIWFTTNSSQSHGANLQKLAANMAVYNTATNGLRDYRAAQEAYDAAVKGFYAATDTTAKTLNDALFSAIDKHAKFLEGKTTPLTISATMGGEAITPGEAVFTSEFGTVTTVKNAGSVQLVPATYQFDLSDGREELAGRYGVDAARVLFEDAAARSHGARRDEDHLDAGAVQPGDLVHEGRNARGVGASVVAGQHVAASLDDDAAVFAGSVHVFAVRASPGVTVRICSPRP